jgi:succinate dehydrogenase/fumarate reductase flavoprotein subunit
MEKISCDVLVIGNGAAGLRAAIASREAGADVLVISKSPPGLGTAPFSVEEPWGCSAACRRKSTWPGLLNAAGESTRSTSSKPWFQRLLCA